MKVGFYDCMEIRMGSAFQICRLRIRGPWIPRLQEDWQDRVAHSPDGRFTALVAWAIDEKNEPGFRIVVLDEQRQRIIRSRRIRGCCEEIGWEDGGVTYRSFRVPKQVTGKFRFGSD
jgi:hypothetical protein